VARPNLVRVVLLAALALAVSFCAQASNTALANFPFAGHFGVSTMTAGRVIAHADEPLGGFVVRLRGGGSMSYGYCITFGHHAPGVSTQYGTAEPFNGTPANADRATIGAMSMLIQRYGHTPGTGHADAVDIAAAEVSATLSHTYDEVDRNGQWRYLGQAGTSVAHADQLLRNARAIAGPYVIDVQLPKTALARGSYSLAVTVRNAYGPVGAGVAVSLAATNASISARTARTDENGRVAATITPQVGAGRATVVATASVIDTMHVLRQKSSTRPGQVQDFVFSGPRPSVYRAEAQVPVTQPTMATQASSAEAVVGSALTDTITVSGTAGTPGLITATLYGPATSASGPWSRVAGSTQVKVTGDGSYTTPPITVSAEGSYSWGESFVPTDQRVPVATTQPGSVTETTTVSQPHMRTQTSAQRASTGSSLTDTIAVTGTAGNQGVITATLYGPAPSNGGPWDAVVGSVELPVDGDGSYATPPIRVLKTGTYSWGETLTIKGQSAPVASTKAGEVSETTVVTAPPPKPHVVVPPRPKSKPSPPRPSRAPATHRIRIETGGESASRQTTPEIVGVLAGIAAIALLIAFRRRVVR